MRQQECEFQDNIAHGNIRSQVEFKRHFAWPPCLQVCIFKFPALVSDFLFVPIVEQARLKLKHSVLVIKDGEVVGYIPRVNCFAMIAIFIEDLGASNCLLPVCNYM